MRKVITRLPIVGPAVADLARGLRDPVTERSGQADLAQNIREVRWLRTALREPVAQARRLLIVSLSYMVYQLKLEAMLGVGLKLQGWRPILLTNSRTNTRAMRKFRAFGIADLKYLEDYPASAAERQIRAAIAESAPRKTRNLSAPLQFAAISTSAYGRSGGLKAPRGRSLISGRQGLDLRRLLDRPADPLDRVAQPSRGAPDPAKRLLILSLTHMDYQVKLQAL